MKLLFVCTGNYYRSRFAEAVFNHAMRQRNLDHSAISRGLRLDDYLNHLSPHAIMGLMSLRIPVNLTSADPNPLTPKDLETADRVVVLDRTEHEPLLKELHPDWVERVIFWDCPDVGQEPAATCLPRIEKYVNELVEEVKAES